MAEALSMKEFEDLVVWPIRGAYRCSEFLSDVTENNSLAVWYGALKYANYYSLQTNVTLWITKNSNIPVLADICNGLDLNARLNENK